MQLIEYCSPLHPSPPPPGAPLFPAAPPPGQVCPYFLSRDLVAHCDVVFMPYNYLLDATVWRGGGEGGV